MEFSDFVCDLATGTDAIIGTDVLGSVLPNTLDIKNGLLFTEGGASLQLHPQDSALSGRVLQWVTARFHPIQRLYYTVLCGLPTVVRCHPVVY